MNTGTGLQSTLEYDCNMRAGAELLQQQHRLSYTAALSPARRRSSVVLDVKCDPCSNECPVFRLRSRSIYGVYLRRASSHQQQRYDLTMGSCPHSVHSDAANNIMNTSDGGN